MIPEETIRDAADAIEHGRFPTDTEEDELWALVDAARAENRRQEIDLRLQKERSKRTLAAERMTVAAGGGEEHRYASSLEAVRRIVGEGNCSSCTVATVDLIRFIKRLDALEDLLGDAEEAQAMWERGYDAGFLKARDLIASQTFVKGHGRGGRSIAERIRKLPVSK